MDKIKKDWLNRLLILFILPILSKYAFFFQLRKFYTSKFFSLETFQNSTASHEPTLIFQRRFIS